jgi:signal transduction histidine kinase
MRVNPVGRRPSLLATIAAATVLGLLLPALLAGTVLIGWRDADRAREEFERDLDDRLDLVAKSLSLLVWNLDRDATQELTKAAAQDTDVVRVTVYEGRAEAPWIDVLHPERRLGDPVIGERVVLREGAAIGRLRVEFDDHLYAEAVSRQRWLYGATVGGQLLISLLLVTWLLNARLVQPLQRLGRFAGDLAAGRFDSPLPAGPADEIGRLGQAMDGMRSALQQHHHHLEDLVRERTTARAEARAAALAANRAKTAFLANMSHEIRTPLNAIIGLTQLMRRDVADDLQRDRLRKVDDAARHLLGVTNQVLDLSKIDAGKLQLQVTAFRVDELLDDLAGMLSTQAEEKGVDFALEAPPGLRALTLVGDRSRIVEVLLNFAGNAVKFTAQGRVVLRAIEQGRGAGQVQLRFEVEDTGVGIEAATLARLFQDFEQGDNSNTRSHGGSGLGLAISRRLATLMGGQVGARSQPGAGSMFWFELSLGWVANPAAHPPPAALPRYDGQRVLLAEDNPVNSEIAVAMLSAVGLEVHVATNGQELLDRFDAVAPALLLLDVQMPVLDGLDTARAVRARGWTGPIVAMTASAFAEERERCLQAGMDDHIAKPAELETLVATVARWLPPTPTPP